MSRLPLIPLQEFSFRHPLIDGGVIKYNAITVGQKAILLGAKESKDSHEKIDAVVQVLNDRITSSKQKAGELPVFLAEYLFLAMYRQSMGNEMRASYTHQKKSDGEKCGHTHEILIPFDQIVIKEYPEHSRSIEITKDISIQFKYPTFESASALNRNATDDQVMMKAIETVTNGDDVISADECTPKEIEAMYNRLTFEDQRNMYVKFWATMPHIHLNVPVKCPSCGGDQNVEFNSVSDFFP